MRLKRIEILGFKSFRDKTSLVFSPGISAIVGPNGCGKSNIVDAMRWVMGEQRVTLLRGKKMDDVIFNGSDESAPVGMAQVSITLENNGRSLNSAYADCTEVTVSRKLYRDGESEYSINNVPCRLLDVREFFLDAGVGTRTYSIVEQEKVFHLIEAKPEQRREFIEEAAGISKYRSRRESAARKIEATRQNLLRLNDLVGEVKSRLNSVTRQAKKAERFKNLKEEVREARLLLSLQALLDLKERKDSLDKEQRSMENKKAEAEKNVASLEAETAELQAQIIENESEAAYTQERYFSIKNDIAVHEQKIEFSRKMLQDLGDRKKENAATIEELRARNKTAAAEMESTRKEIQASESAIAEMRAFIDKQRERLSDFKAAEEEIREALDREKEKHTEAMTETVRLKNLVSSLEREVENLERKKDRELAEIGSNRQRLTTLEAQSKDLSALLDEEKNEIERLRKKESALRRQLEEKRLDLDLHSESIEKLKETAAVKASRLASLREIQESFEWCNEGTRAVLKESVKPNWTGGAVQGIVADHLEVPAEYEAAVEAVLGDKIQSILVECPEDGIRAINFLKQSGAGRGNFMPIKNGRSEEPRSERIPLFQQAVPLADIVKCSGKDRRRFIECLLGDVLVIPNLQKGMELWKMNGFTGTFVTIDGDIIGRDGVLTGGGGKGEGYSLLRNKREMSELEREINSLNDDLAERQAVKNEKASHIEALEGKVEELRGGFHEKQLLVGGIEKDIERLAGEIDWINQRLKVQTFNAESMEREISEATDRIDKSREEMSRIEAKTEDGQRRISLLQEQWKNAAERLKEEEQLLVDSRITLSTLEEKRQSGLRSLKSMEYSIGEIENRIVSCKRDIEVCNENIEKTRAEGDASQALLAKLYSDFESVGKWLAEKKNQQEILEGARREKETLLSNARKTLSALSNEIHKISLDIQEVTMQIGNLKSGVQERYRQDLQELIHTFEPLEESRREELSRKLEADKKRLEDFGDVNLLALEEYEELKERYDFLTTQTEDLKKSLETLQKTISRINQVSRKRFAETFEAVNNNFKQVFPRLFPGGKGKLKLTDESDLLETGVDVEIQIPGKKPQNLSLLSGGEKALSAVSLIMAILMHRPTPFLILDEADAPLDDSNVTLFTRLVSEIAKESQIIYITHNKRTMETADNLIGVTMEKSGISTIVSVSMN